MEETQGKDITKNETGYAGTSKLIALLCIVSLSGTILQIILQNIIRRSRLSLNTVECRRMFK